MLEIEVKKDVFEEIRYMDDDLFNKYLKNRLKLFVMELENNDEEKLVEKKNEIKERIDKMLEEIRSLSDFSSKAENDKKEMEMWVEKLDLENKRLLKELKAHENHN